MHFVILGIFVVTLVFAPQWWARHTFKKYSKHNDSFPGTGGQLARHLLDQQGLQHIPVYITKSEEKAVNQILRAAALTYVAASLASLLNLARWIAILRRR